MLKRFIITRIGYKGGRRVTWFGFPVIWHTWQDLQNLVTSDFNPGQKKISEHLIVFYRDAQMAGQTVIIG